MNIFFTIVIIIIASYLLSLLAKKIKIPSVVMLIFTGLIFGYPFFKSLIIEPNTDLIFKFGDISLLCLMFLAGLESSWKFLYSQIRSAMFIAFFAALTPFFVGFIVFKLMGFSLLISLIIGICMSITAEATKARVLLELNRLRTKIGAVMMDAGIIDDVLGLSLFIIVTYALKVAYLKENLLVFAAILSFFVGVFLQKKFDGIKQMVYIKESLVIFVVPFFFISMGIHFDLNSLILNPILLILIIVIAITGKLLGSLLTKHFTKLSWEQLYLIGWAMNSRGAVELAIAMIAFRTNLIPVDIYSSLIIMALTTTLIFPFVITRIIKKHPKIMN